MFSDSLVTKIKRKVKYMYVAITVFYILKHDIEQKSHSFKKSITTKFQYHTLSDSSIVPTSEDCTAVKFHITEH